VELSASDGFSAKESAARMRLQLARAVVTSHFIKSFGRHPFRENQYMTHRIVNIYVTLGAWHDGCFWSIRSSSARGQRNLWQITAFDSFGERYPGLFMNARALGGEGFG
jgi:hypothetical protein